MLASESVGRIAWSAGSGQIIRPITYVYADPVIGFRTAPDGRLAELVRPTAVAFEVDRLDDLHNEAVSVIVQGVTSGANRESGRPGWVDQVVPWAGGARELAIEVHITKITGRRIHRGHS
ncbi:hypothetical protein GCM10011575_38920 [Microlunatus endophyticus]|uniref:Pyridoxamine 5'-phosphate oxidase n=1 Tax=Microlunatus endophyticus TaxID=1716077 RepID=A0A917W704_9ACTN|nr:hypothetical protein GCM10011575_38920 [Microlunatus endophyticus]